MRALQEQVLTTLSTSLPPSTSSLALSYTNVLVASMPVNHNLMVLFGPTENSYFVTYGRMMRHSNMPQSLVDTFKNQAEMNPMKVAWLRQGALIVLDFKFSSMAAECYDRMHPNGKTWAAMNMYTNNSTPRRLPSPNPCSPASRSLVRPLDRARARHVD